MKKNWILKVSENIKKYNASLTPSQKTLHASKAAKARWDKVTKEERIRHAKMMAHSRR